MKNYLTFLLVRIGSRAAKRKLEFLDRPPISPDIWLSPLVKKDNLNDAKLIVNLFGKSYGIDPAFFRGNDTVGAIHATDWFGDCDLEIGALMRSKGVSSLNGETSLIEFVQKMLPLDSSAKNKLQRMLRFSDAKK